MRFSLPKSATRSTSTARPKPSPSLCRLLVLFAAMFALSSCATWMDSGSIYRGPCTHLGLRPATDGPGDYAVTVQVSTDYPRCPRRPLSPALVFLALRRAIEERAPAAQADTAAPSLHPKSRVRNSRLSTPLFLLASFRKDSTS